MVTDIVSTRMYVPKRIFYTLLGNLSGHSRWAQPRLSRGMYVLMTTNYYGFTCAVSLFTVFWFTQITRSDPRVMLRRIRLRRLINSWAVHLKWSTCIHFITIATLLTSFLLVSTSPLFSGCDYWSFREKTCT